MKELASARMILIIVAASYVVSAAVLAWVKARGQAVPAWAIAGWLVTGVAGIVLALMLAEKRPAVWWTLLVVLGPWMAYALVGDAGERRWWMVAVDAAGLVAIARALYVAWPGM